MIEKVVNLKGTMTRLEDKNWGHSMVMHKNNISIISLMNEKSHTLVQTEKVVKYQHGNSIIKAEYKVSCICVQGCRQNI